MSPQLPNTSSFSRIRSIAFVDSGLSDTDVLIEGLSDRHVVQLPSDANGIEEITQVLSQHQNLDSIHIFSHGSSGALQLGNATLSQAFMSEYQDDLQHWGNALLSEGDVFLYGCDVAAGEEGKAFVEQVSQLTQADVAASDDITGYGADWDLEVTTGNIEATISLDQATQSSYRGQLNLLTNGSFEANALDNDQWRPFNASAVSGWQSLNGEAIEIWDSGHNGVASTEGSNHMELDYRAGALDAIYQDVKTQAGRTYQLTFDMRSRRNNFNSDDEAVVVEWNGVKTKIDGYRAARAGEWTTITTEVIGTGGNNRLLFRESATPGASNGYGPLLDNISLQASNLVVNGSFEANPVDNDRWTTLNAADVPGWQSLNGERLELWDSGHNGVASSNGSNHLEMDYRAGTKFDAIYQDLQTQAGQTYQLSFDIRSRSSNFNSNDEAVAVEWNGKKIKIDGFRAAGANQWTTITTTVTGTGKKDRLLFRESMTPGASNGYGGLLDNISLKPSGTIGTNPPVKITSNGGGDSASVRVNEGVKAVTDFEVNVGDAQVNYLINDGADKDLFTVDPISGKLSFINAPDWETPQDADGNNVYEVNVVAAGATSGDGQFITVVVNNVENPDPTPGGGNALKILNTTPSVLVQEGKTYVTDFNVNDAEDGDILYRLNDGADRNLFNIDAKTGVLTFKQAQDWEKPVDAGKDNNYEVNVLAIRGNEATSKFLTVTVANILNESLAPIDVYLQGGQSNSAGEALTANISDTKYLKPFPKAQIWSIVKNDFVDLASGFDGQTTSMGPELSFGRSLVERTKKNAHLVKYALGGTSLAVDWNPDGTGTQYNTFVNTVDNALANLAASGVAYNVAGFVWQQGESDTYVDAFAPAYEGNLTNFIGRVREMYGTNLKVSLGQLRSDLPTSPANRTLVQTAQKTVANKLAGVTLVNTDALGPANQVLKVPQGDLTHYNANGQVALGIAHAKTFS